MVTPFHSGLKPSLGVSLNSNHPMNRDLFLWWMINEGGGTRLYDLVAKREGVLTNMEATDWIDGRYGKALDFDGSNEYVKYLYTGFAFPVTFAARFRFDSLSGAPVIFSYCNDADNSGFRMQSVTSTLCLVFGAVAVYSFTGLSLSVGVNYSAVITVTGNLGTARGYLRAENGGVLSASASVGTTGGAPNAWFLGQSGFDTDYMDGSISDAQVWTRLLSPEQIHEVLLHPYGLPDHPRLLIGVPKRRGKRASVGGGTANPWYYYAQA